MISLASETTDSKGRRARGWLFYDAECNFCTRIARILANPMRRRQLGIASLQDPRVTSLLGLPPHELLLAVRYLSPEGSHYSGSDALLALAREFGWARPLIWFSRIPGAMRILRSSYRWLARHRKCAAEVCAHKATALQP